VHAISSKTSWVNYTVFYHEVIIGGNQFVGSAPTRQVVITQKPAIEYEGNNMTKATFAAKRYVYVGLTVSVVQYIF